MAGTRPAMTERERPRAPSPSPDSAYPDTHQADPGLLILGGTTEGYALAAALAGLTGLRVISSLAGRTANPRLPAGETRIGGFGGPDGLAWDPDGNLLVAHTGIGTVWRLSPRAEPTLRIASCAGMSTTNLALGGADGRDLFITESETGSILRARLEKETGAP